MVTIKRNPGIRLGLGVALLAVLLLGNIQPYTIALSDLDLAGVRGTGFWNDPCTWDGFAFGGGAVFCAAGHLGACLGSAIGLLRAVKVDNCF